MTSPFMTSPDMRYKFFCKKHWTSLHYFLFKPGDGMLSVSRGLRAIAYKYGESYDRM